MLTSTYRLQIHKDFRLSNVRELVPYFRDLGISHVYSSPLLTARPGSTHGYDVVDPARLNPEVGTEEELRALADDLHVAGLGLILDIVPNHMGIGPANPYWEDVLRHGQQSRYARWFDIDWDAHPKRRGKVVLPVLGGELADVLEKGELGLDISESGGVRLKYFDNSYPLDPATLPAELQLVQFDPNAKQAAEEWVCGDEGKTRLRELLKRQHYVLAFWRSAPSDINYRRFFDVNDLIGLRMSDPHVFDETHAKLLEWVSEGIIDGFRIDHVDGLTDPLGYLTRLREEVRRRVTARSRASTVDFPIFVEKILSPGEHLRRGWPVQGTTGYETLNDIESIFIHYDGACAIERMYRRIRRLEDDVTFEHVAREGRLKVLRGALRADIRRLGRLLAGVLASDRGPGSEVLGPRWERSRGPKTQDLGPKTSDLGPRTSDPGPATTTTTLAPPDSLTERALVDGLTQLLASLPVYRTYIDGRTRLPHPDDRAVLERAVARAEQNCNEIEHAVVQRIAAVFLEPLEEGRGKREEERGTAEALSSPFPLPPSRRLEFIQKFQQTSGPATAKGVEDTALYAYIPLASRNEVGGEPDRKLHDAVARFHKANLERARDWPLALVTTNTHDTKRSADLRARIDVLSEVSREWERHVERWRRLNRRLKVTIRGRLSPDTNAEYLLYQTLVGLWPAPRDNQRAEGLPEREWFEDAAQRLEAYMIKAIKEAKEQTSWTEPDDDYEKSVKTFAHAILNRATNAEFLSDVARFVHSIARAGMWNALARTLVHLTVPGTPDTYQGDELWNFALVDPDNRRPVNYEERKTFLAEMNGGGPVPSPFDPRLKLFVARHVLHTRREMPLVFQEGAYIPLDATGAHADRVVAFARVHGRDASITIVPRLTMPLLQGENADVTDHDAQAALRPPPSAPVVWADTTLRLPADIAAQAWHSALTGRAARVEQGSVGTELRLTELLTELPLDLLTTAR